MGSVNAEWVPRVPGPPIATAPGEPALHRCPRAQSHGPCDPARHMQTYIQAVPAGTRPATDPPAAVLEVPDLAMEEAECRIHIPHAPLPAGKVSPDQAMTGYHGLGCFRDDSGATADQPNQAMDVHCKPGMHSIRLDTTGDTVLGICWASSPGTFGSGGTIAAQSPCGDSSPSTSGSPHVPSDLSACFDTSPGISASPSLTLAHSCCCCWCCCRELDTSADTSGAQQGSTSHRAKYATYL